MEKKLSTKTKSTGDQLLKINDRNLTQIFENTMKDAIEKHDLLNTLCDERSIVSKCTNSLTNVDSGYAEIPSKMSESSVNIYIHSKGNSEDCKLFASSCSLCEFWKSGIKRTSTPFHAPTIAFEKQNVYEIQEENVKILEFGNDLQEKNQDFDSKKTNEVSEKEKNSLRASMKVVCENSADRNIMKRQAEPSCSSKMSKIRANENGGAIRKLRVLTSQGRRRSGKFVSMAEAMQKFHMQTPKRFRTMPNSAVKLMSSNRYQTSEHKSSKNQFSGSSNNNSIEPKIEVELKLRKKENNLPAQGCSRAKKFKENSCTSRWAERNKVLLEEQKKPDKRSRTTKASTFVFRARPMPSFKSPKILKSRKPLTVAQSPVWARTKNHHRKFE